MGRNILDGESVRTKTHSRRECVLVFEVAAGEQAGGSGPSSRLAFLGEVAEEVAVKQEPDTKGGV